MNLEINIREESVRLNLCEKLKNEGVKDIKREFVVNQGRIDLVTEYEIIEIKIANLWKGALGQVLAYGKDPKVSTLNKRIHLFGNMRVRKNMIEETCKEHNVTVSYEDSVEDWCDSDIEEESLKCEFCDKELSTNSSLKSHQTKTKYCLEKQKLLDININIILVQCQYCDKNFIHKHKRDAHQDNCVEKIKREYLLHHENEILKLKLELDTQMKKYDNIILIVKERDNEIIILKDKISLLNIEKEKSNIYSSLFNKDHDFILDQSRKMSERQSITTTNNTIRGKTITMNALNLSQERLDSIKDTYTIKDYEKGGIGQADWVVENVLKDENGNIVYKCTDKNRKNFVYHDDKGNTINDIHAKKLKEAILPMFEIKLREYKKIKFNELADQSDDESELFEKCNNLYKENKEMGSEFDKRLIEKTYDK